MEADSKLKSIARMGLVVVGEMLYGRDCCRHLAVSFGPTPSLPSYEVRFQSSRHSFHVFANGDTGWCRVAIIDPAQQGNKMFDEGRLADGVLGANQEKRDPMRTCGQAYCLTVRE